MNPLLVLVIAAQINVAVTNCTPQDFYDHVCVPESRFVEWQVKLLPISTRRVEPLVAEPEPATEQPCDDCIISSAPLWQDDDPFDVPAVQKAQRRCMFVYPEGGGPLPDTAECPRTTTVTVWTCEDKRRVLMQAENGTRHCILFNSEK